jgi:catechol 2,3-dioxygenase-like lactoylglutathione lyase family enzyme
MIKTQELTYINLRVADLQRSLEFCQVVFGLETLFWDGDSMVFLRTQGASDTITLSLAREGEPVGGGGLDHFVFRFQDEGDVSHAIQMVLDAGGRLISSGESSTRPGKLTAYVADPDGYVIQMPSAA